MSKGKIVTLVILLIVLVVGGISAGLVLSKNSDNKQKSVSRNTETKATAETQAPVAKAPTALPINYSGTGNYESEVFTLATGSLYLSANIGVDKSSIDSGSGGYASIGVRLVNVNGISFPGVDEFNNGEGGTLSVSKTINKSDGQSSYSLSEKVNVVAGDYKIEVKGGPSGLGPNLTSWTTKLYL